MAKFLTSNELNSELEKLIESAKEDIILISPYIKLHNRYVSAIKKAIKGNERLKVVIVFGKNEDDKKKSLNEKDFIFLKSLPNIEIRYEQFLHAKYYANEFSALITSMNLYDYSQNNNIEVGVLTKTSFLEGVTKAVTSAVIKDESIDNVSHSYFSEVVEQSILLYQRVPEFKKKNFGLSEKYVESVVLKDELSSEFQEKEDVIVERNRGFLVTKNKPLKQYSDRSNIQGYCIRTGIKIPFDLEKPMSYQAYNTWAQFRDEYYEEQYCHFTGESSNGQTCMARPVLRKNWSKMNKSN